MVADKFECWWCSTPSSPDDLVRLDNVLSLAGFKPGAYRKSGHRRICRNCLLLYANLRVIREHELRALPQLPHQPAQ